MASLPPPARRRPPSWSVARHAGSSSREAFPEEGV